VQSDVLLWNGHICKIIFGRSASVISANNASLCKIYYHSNRGDCLVCLCTVWGKMAELDKSCCQWNSPECRLYSGLYSINCWQHNVQSLTGHSRLAPKVILLDTARHVTPCKLSSSYRHSGLSVTKDRNVDNGATSQGLNLHQDRCDPPNCVT
jgi:hypothetical protein